MVQRAEQGAERFFSTVPVPVVKVFDRNGFPVGRAVIEEVDREIAAVARALADQAPDDKIRAAFLARADRLDPQPKPKSRGKPGPSQDLRARKAERDEIVNRHFLEKRRGDPTLSSRVSRVTSLRASTDILIGVIGMRCCGAMAVRPTLTAVRSGVSRD